MGCAKQSQSPLGKSWNLFLCGTKQPLLDSPPVEVLATLVIPSPVDASL